jgi:hypothetical protein
MAAGSLPPPPINDKPGSFTWLEWYRQLRNYISTSGSVPWYIINFAGSNITDLATYLHNSLQGLQGGAANEKYHLTSAENTALTNSTQNTWTPAFTNLTVVSGTGGATYAGRYSRIGRTVFYTVTITCTGTATTASTAGSTYCTLPIGASYDDTVTIANAATGLGLGTGYLDSTNDRCYPCTWVATGNKIIISGKYEV